MDAREKLISMLRDDTEFLARLHLMDYSLLLGKIIRLFSFLMVYLMQGMRECFCSLRMPEILFLFFLSSSPTSVIDGVSIPTDIYPAKVVTWLFDLGSTFCIISKKSGILEFLIGREER